MNPIDTLRAMDSIAFRTISYNRLAPWPLTSGPRSVQNRCVTKSAGSLNFTMNSVRDLGVPLPFDFDVLFTGEPATDGSPVVTWSVAQNIDKYYGVPGVDVHIWNVTSGFTAMVQLIPPSDQFACDGSRKTDYLTLTTIGSNNELVIRGDTVTKGAHLHLADETISATEISVAATGERQPAKLSVFIGTQDNRCNPTGIVNGSLKCYATVTGDAFGQLTYDWSVTGNGTPDGQTHVVANSWFKVLLGSSETQPASISVTVTDALGNVATGTLDYVPLPAVTRLAAQLRCRMEQLFPPQPYHMGDPWRGDIRDVPFTRVDLIRINRISAAIAETALELLRVQEEEARRKPDRLGGIRQEG